MILNKLQHFDASKYNNQAVRLTAAGERSLINGHPWIFSNSILKIKPTAKTGDLCVIFNKSGKKILGVGLFDENSPIRIKVLSNEGGVKIDKSFFKSLILNAFKKRIPLFDTNTNSFRLIYGENDYLPSLIIDVYNDVIVIKLYSVIWCRFLTQIIEVILEELTVSAIILRLSRNTDKELNGLLDDGDLLYGKLHNPIVPFFEHGVQFSANVISGHKTGYFLDHRENRRRVGLISKNKKVLDIFSYAGGFSVHALTSGAKSVTSLDISSQALLIAKQNASLNSFIGKHITIADDAFVAMNKLIAKKEVYDVVVIDPPSFAKSKSEISLAKKKYKQLAEIGAKLTAKNGYLILASCSSRIVADSFFEMNKQGLNQSNRYFILEKKTFHDIDHPIRIPEGAYLKCGYYKFIDD